MANILAPTLNNQPPINGLGNKSVVVMKVTLASAQIADVVRFGIIPAGARLVDAKTIHGQLGSSVTMTVGYAPVVAGTTAPAADADKLSNDANTAAANTAATVRYNGPAIMFKNDCYVTATIAGGAATGDVEVQVEYEFVGLE